MLQLHIQSPLLAILHDQLIIVVDKINLLLAWISTPAMENEVAGLRDKLHRTSQEAKEKLQQDKPVGSGSGMSHK